jgi:hypothetical protein
MKTIAEHHEQAAIIVTSNLDFTDWDQAFPANRLLATASLREGGAAGQRSGEQKGKTGFHEVQVKISRFRRARKSRQAGILINPVVRRPTDPE